MSRVREISVRSPDPKGLCDLLEQVLGFTVLRSEGSVMILTDGYLQVGITSAGAEDGRTTLDHVGVQVDDLEETCTALTGRGWSEAGNSTPATRFFDSPESLQFEMRAPGWGWSDVIAGTTELFELVPARNQPDRSIPLPPISLAGERDLSADAELVDGSPGPGYVPVAHTGDIPPGRMARAELGRSAILISEYEGTYYAVWDACPHLPRIGRVSEGQRQGRVLECPIHRSRFDLVDGRVLEPPARRGLTCMDVVVRDEQIWVKVETVKEASGG
jgi:3-phenylpropionate/trans-cinnamate dioxygenase ferredoxin subunit